jgi:hypothetical protein
MARSEILPHTLSPTDLGHSKFEPSQCTKFECFKITNNSNEKELPLNSTYRRLKIYCMENIRLFAFLTKFPIAASKLQLLKR